MNGAALVMRADALRLPLPDESVDLIITSPPYFALRSYRDAGQHYDGQIGSEATPQRFLEALWACTAEWMRVLKLTGSIWVNLGDKYAGSGGHNNSGISSKSTLSGNGHTGGIARSGAENKIKATLRSAPDRYNQDSGGIPAKSLMGLPWRYAIGCIDRLGLILRAEVVWSKVNGLPESVTDRVRRSHEQWFHFVKQGRYFAAVDEVREPHAESTVVRYQTESRPSTRANDAERYGKARDGLPAGHEPNPLGKLPGSVWTIPSEPLLIPDWAKEKYGLPDHFAAFPQEWPRRIILGWSPSGICTVCGEGRRPVIEGGRSGDGGKPEKAAMRVASFDWQKWKESTPKTILGYTCACPEPMASIRPAVILDPFGGTGTTALVAKALGRIGISIDLSHDYCKLARWRIEQSLHGQRAESRTWGEAQGTLL